jgi:hypothetical protein
MFTPLAFHPTKVLPVFLGLVRQCPGRRVLPTDANVTALAIHLTVDLNSVIANPSVTAVARFPAKE